MITDIQKAIWEEIQENERKEQKCEKHEFERIKINGLPKYKCRNCGCIEDVSWVCGYNRGLEHANR